MTQSKDMCFMWHNVYWAKLSNMHRCLREFRVGPPKRLFTGGKSGRVAGELPWGRVEPSWRRRDGSSSSSWGHFSSGRGQKSFGWIFLISYNFSFENDPQNRAWLKNMILVRSVQRVFKPWQPPGRVLLTGKCYHHESHRRTLQKKSQNSAFWKLWLISRSVGVILPTTAYILRLKNPPVR